MDKLLRRLTRAAAVLLALVITAALVQPSVKALPREVREKAIPATVKIHALDNELVPVASGSGSIIAQTGQILTNNHVVTNNDTGKLENDDGIVLISITTDPRRPANPAFLGKVVRTDPKLDLALVTVVSDLSGTNLAGCLTLPTYDIGDSDSLTAGDQVGVIGFPGLGGNSVTYTEGIISGFEGPPTDPWLKTDAEVNHGNSGGSAIDTDGKLIGVPSAGRSDVEAAGKISLIRPINAAARIISGVTELGVPGCGDSPSLGPVPAPGDYGPAGVGFLGYYLSPADQKSVTTAPSGITELHAWFGYAAVPSNTPVGGQWFKDGQPASDPNQDESWPWEVGDGDFGISLSNPNGLPDGVYSLKLTVGAHSITTPDITVGGGEAAQSVTVRGRVLSADTDRPLADAVVVVLAPDVTWDNVDFDNPDHFADVVTTNADGYFQTNAAFAVDQKYYIGVAADGYEGALYDAVDLNELQPDGGGFVNTGDILLKAN